MDAEALVRLPEITDAQEIARTKNDSWRVGYRGLLPDSILDGLDDARSTANEVAIDGASFIVDSVETCIFNDDGSSLCRTYVEPTTP